MSQKKSDKIKYGLLKAVDVTGFKVLDPVIRLCFGEEARKQSKDILKFLIVPTLFVLTCLWLWSAVAPRHKTKSGQVPTPGRVLQAAGINDTIDQREQEKENDFEREGEQRLATITAVQKLLDAKKAESARLKEELAQTEVKVQAELEEKLAPFREREEELKTKHKNFATARRANIEFLAQEVVDGASPAEDLLNAIREDKDLIEEEKQEKAEFKQELAEVQSDPPEALKEAQMASNSVANEVSHLTTRLQFLNAQNKSVRVQGHLAKAADASQKLGAATTKEDTLTAATQQVNAERKAAKAEEQKFAPAATVYFQTKRSLFTVFCGFLMAAAVAIPIGIMCGVNRVVMACLTPIISIFKPVSPVVWLLIFQIVIGAFFLPDPEKYPLFVLLGAIPGIKELGVNPAMVFCSCTVAMCAVWPALVNTALGVSSIDKDHLNVARVLRLGFWSRLFKIIIPSSLPLVFAGLRISLGVGWMVLIAAEALSSSDGLGKFVWDEYQNGSSHSFANIIYACFVIGIIGFFLDRMMIFFQRLVSFDEGATAV